MKQNGFTRCQSITFVEPARRTSAAWWPQINIGCSAVQLQAPQISMSAPRATTRSAPQALWVSILLPCTQLPCRSGVAHTQPARANSGSTLLLGWHSTCNPTQVLGHAAHMRRAMRRAMCRMIQCSVPGKERLTNKVEGRQAAFCLVQIYHYIKWCVPYFSLSKRVILNHGRQHNYACTYFLEIQLLSAFWVDQRSFTFIAEFFAIWNSIPNDWKLDNALRSNQQAPNGAMKMFF